MTLIQRRRRELLQKLVNLEAEFAQWEAASDLHQPLEKHNTQVRRVACQLRGMVRGVRPTVESVATMTDAHDAEIRVLDVHRLWDHFRSKLVYRNDPAFGPFLRAADEFAWACYQPAQQAGIPQLQNPAAVKEPPLVFLSGSWSPYTAPRGIPWRVLPTTNEERLSADAVAELVGTLPVPLISVPWSQAKHLPDLVVGHEVGHAVIADFGLRDAVRTAAEAAIDHPERRQAWKKWAVELFCDWYGVLASGPAYGTGLVDYVSKVPDPTAQMQPESGSGEYPTEALRAAAVIAMIRELDELSPVAERPDGFAAHADRLAAEWHAVCPQHAMVAFDDDVAPVVAALASVRFAGLGDRTAAEVLPFGATELQQAEDAKMRLLAPQERAIPRQPVRTLVGGARLAWVENPERFAERGGTERFRDAMLCEIQAGVRAGAAPRAGLEAADLEAGEALLARIDQLRSGTLDALDDSLPKRPDSPTAFGVDGGLGPVGQEEGASQ